MSKGKVIRVLIEIPERWVDLDSPLGFVSSTIRQQVERELRDALVEQYIKKVKLPQLKITPGEVKERILDLLAQEQVDKLKGGDHD